MTEDVDLSRAGPHPVPAGGCTVHTGRTLHYTGPNNTHRHLSTLVLVIIIKIIISLIFIERPG